MGSMVRYGCTGARESAMWRGGWHVNGNGGGEELEADAEMVNGRRHHRSRPILRNTVLSGVACRRVSVIKTGCT